MTIIRLVMAFFCIKDIETFWIVRNEILEHQSKKNVFKNLVCKVIRRHYCSAIPVSHNIKEFRAPHGFYGIFISPDAKIGNRCTLFQHVTIGANYLPSSKMGGGAPSIGDNCYIGAGAKIIGNIKIGNNVRIGAGAIVAEDIPDNCTVVMDKPRVIIHGV